MTTERAAGLGRRAERLRRAMSADGLDGVVIAPGPNLTYYTGVVSQLLERPFLLFIPAEGRPGLVAPVLESGPFRRSPLGIDVHAWDDGAGPGAAFTEVRQELDLRGTWGCEGRVPFAFFSHVATGRSLKLVSGDGTLRSVREVKEPAELEKLQKAADMLCSGLARVPELAREGVTELALSNELRREIFARGAETVDFCMVQAGPNAADPHSAPSDRVMRKGDGIVVDAGCTYQGYYADVTRSLVLGGNPRFELVYGAVLDAQLAAIDAAGDGVSVGEVDRSARSHLEKAGLGRYFIHRTGHGLGLEVHEAPFIVPGGQEKLTPGMVFTVEPGAYIPGKLGVRIEDDVALRGRGARVVTADLPKDFGWWKR